jgi:hypothetical protein
MSRNLTDEDVTAICNRLTEFSGLTPEEHREHHEALATFIQWHKDKLEWRKKVSASVGGWVIIGILAFIGKSTWAAVATMLNIHN